MRRPWLMLALPGLLAGCYSSAGSRHDAQPDHSSGYVGTMVSYQLIVEQAVQYHGDVCDDFPEQWYRALFVSIPEG